MTALDKKINQLAARHRWNVTPVHDRFIPCYSIVPMDRQERDRIKATLDRCKGLKVKVEQVFSPYAWTCTIYVFDLAEWNAQQERSRLEWSIVNAYSEAYHFNGHDSAGAKLAAQHKAAEIGALAPFPLAAFQRHGWRWRCSIRVNFAVCRRGQILHLTGVRSRCRALT